MMVQEILIGKDRVSLGRSIGKGGEGEVFELNGKLGLAAKIYSISLRRQREYKVRAMVGAGLAVKTEFVAYPSQIATDPRGNFLGFVMRLVSGYRSLHELYSPKSRQRHFPKVDYRFIVRAALNVSRAVGQVHQTGCVIGDLNHSGVLVASDAIVALIDADSFQFRMNGKSYPCVVGVPDFTPPELRGRNLGSVERSIEHDNFGLSVAIFHLLFMGRHPYAGRYQGPDISLSEAIAQNRFAFSLTRQSATRTTPPPRTLTLDRFPGVIGSAFENAFGLSASERPSASDWIERLTKLESSLSRCSKVKTHYYPSNSKGCVWCELAASSNFDMFPDISVVAHDTPTDVAGTERAIQEILAFCFPTAVDLLPQPSTASVGGSKALRNARTGKCGQAILGVLMIAGAIGGFILAAQVWFIWVGLGIWGGIKASDREVETDPFHKAFTNADTRIQRELDSFVRGNGLTKIVKVRSDLNEAITAYKTHDDRLVSEMKKLKSTREARQRTAYLDQFSIRRASISGIGPAKTATLISFGIETAADVNQSAVLQVPGFGNVMTRKMMDWRRQHETRFRCDPTPNAQDVADEKTLRARFTNAKAKLESRIRDGLRTLRNAKALIKALPAKARGNQSLRQAVEERSRAEQDLKLLGVPVPNSTVSLSVALPSQPARP